MDTNAVGSSVAGASAEKIAALPNWRESELFSAEERAALAFAEGETRTSQHVYDRRLAAAHGHAP